MCSVRPSLTSTILELGSKRYSFIMGRRKYWPGLWKTKPATVSGSHTSENSYNTEANLLLSRHVTFTLEGYWKKEMKIFVQTAAEPMMELLTDTIQNTGMA